MIERILNFWKNRFYADLWGKNWTGGQLGLECRVN
jgi:hypothetical protein